jgi:lysophospholipase L1-like esterase
MQKQIASMNGMDVLAIGDSLFGGHSLADGEQWLEILAARCGWNLSNLGANGWTVTKNDKAYADPSQIRASMYDRLMNDTNYKFGSTKFYRYGSFTGKTASDVDVIFLEGGWNDFNWGMPLGTASDTVGSTYMGAVNSMVKKLLETYPNAKVVLITSWHTGGTRADGAQRMDFVANGMKEVYSTNYADNDRVLLIDAGNPDVAGIHMGDATWSAQYAMDSAHLNAEGMKVMADSMQTLIWRHVIDKK